MNKLNHVALIMDGNGRWGLKHKRNRNSGHLEGVKVVKKIVSAALELKIPIITFYVFSSENWKRPLSEKNYLFSLIEKYFQKELNKILNNGIQVNFIGRKEKLPIKIQKILKLILKKTKLNNKLIINLAINYGAKNELIDAFKKIKKKKLPVTEKIINKNLYLDIPFPDILIRTGGKRRLSNFMLWQIAYTEIYFLDKLWPDFTKKDFSQIINSFYTIERNFGNI